MTTIEKTNESDTFIQDKKRSSSRPEFEEVSDTYNKLRKCTDSNFNGGSSSYNSHHSTILKPSEVYSGSSLDSTTRISVILDDHLQSTIDSSTCDDPNCTKTRFLSLRSRQSLLERINTLEAKINQQQQHQRTLTKAISDSNKDSMEKEKIVSLVEQKERRIQDLERLVDDQRKLHRKLMLQEARQVEEKAAKIKEWVANKLKELEDQNKKLKEQNKRQKEQVETLNNKLAILSPLVARKLKDGGCGKTKKRVEKTPVSNRNDIVNFVDSNRSLSTKRRHNNNSFQPISSSSNSDDDQGSTTPVRNTLDSLDYPVTESPVYRPVPNASINGSKLGSCNKIKRGNSDKKKSLTVVAARRQKSPVYDSVMLEPPPSTAEDPERRIQLENDSHDPSQKSILYSDSNVYDAPHINPDHSQDHPPPPPMHQSDRWEQALYKLAQETCAQIKAQHLDGGSNCNSSHNLLEEKESTRNSLESNSKQQSTIPRKNLLDIIRPTFTNILGEQVNENLILDSDSDIFLELSNSGSNAIESSTHRISNDNSSSRSSQHVPVSQCRSHSYDMADPYDVPSLEYSSIQLDSPMRFKNNHRDIIRTQSMRRPPVIESLFDIISTDLMKRGYLLKPGAIKNHRRWFVLKNFDLYCYKNENEELTKINPDLKFKLTPNCRVTASVTSGENNYPFKISSQEKMYQLIAESSDSRDEWLRIIGIALSMSDLNPDTLNRSHSGHEGMVSMVRQGHTKRCYAILVDHVLFFLKAKNDPIPIGYLPLKESKVREISGKQESYDDEQSSAGSNYDRFNHECSLAIYPKYAISCDPTYLTLANQQDVDKWFYHIVKASRSDQSSGTPYERSLFKIMMKRSSSLFDSSYGSDDDDDQNTCTWYTQEALTYIDRPISQPLTTLPNESSKLNAVELFKSIQLFTQVPLDPIGIDYHVCLLQNCLQKYLDNPELRNEFYAQIIKQTTYIRHNCGFFTPLKMARNNNFVHGQPISPNRCYIEINPINLDNVHKDKHSILSSSLSEDYRKLKLNSESEISSSDKHKLPPVPSSSKEILQAFQILSATLSLTLPSGRIRWWLENHLSTCSNEASTLGKYAMYCRQAFERTLANGPREMIPSRTEILGLILRNPYDHSHPHSVPLNFMDDSYILVGADGSTTIEEFMSSLCSQINVRTSRLSDFYIFSDDPLEGNIFHILEPQRKLMDVIGWWEHTFRREHSGRFENTKVIRLVCKKRLLLGKSAHETEKEKLLITHQINHEIVSGRLPISDALALELGALMCQIELKDYRLYDKGNIEEKLKSAISKYTSPSIKFRSQSIVQHHNPSISQLAINNHHSDHNEESPYQNESNSPLNELANRWQVLDGRIPSDCIRIYLNCVRKLNT